MTPAVEPDKKRSNMLASRWPLVNFIFNLKEKNIYI
jgi:hypothetical protein